MVSINEQGQCIQKYQMYWEVNFMIVNVTFIIPESNFLSVGEYV